MSIVNNDTIVSIFVDIEDSTGIANYSEKK
jgi:hypothetical protein